jgi:hypothetical protein
MKMSDITATGWFTCVPVLLAIVTVFLLVACASTTGITGFYLDPADGERSVFTHEGLRISSRYLDDGERVQYLRASGREALAREIGELPLSTFLLDIANGSGSEVIVNPASIRFVPGSGPMLSPVSYAHLYMVLPREEGRQTVLREFQGITFDRPVTVPPGGREEKLLLFQRPEKVAKEVAVVLDGIYLGGAHMNAVLDFKAIPLEE